MKKYLEKAVNPLKESARKGNLFPLVLLAVVMAAAYVLDPLSSFALCAGIGLLATIDEKSLDEEQKKFIEGMDESLESCIKGYLDDNMEHKDFVKKIDELSESVKSLSNDHNEKIGQKEFEEFKSEVNSVLLKIKSATERKPDGKAGIKSLEQQIADQLKDYTQKDANGIIRINLKDACKNSPSKKVHIDLLYTKANTPITTAGADHIGGVTIDPSISVPARAESEIRKYANVSNIATRSLIYAELYDITGDAAWVPEGGLKPSMNAKMREVTVTAGKVALTTTLTEEALYDTNQIVAEIRSEIINRIGVKEEDGILYGTGEDGEIKGVFTDIPEFTLDGLSVENPNYFDAIIAAYTQIVSVSDMNFMPNLVRVNPIDFANMKLTKDKNGNYLFPPFTLMNGMLINDLQIAASTSIAQGEFVIGDFNYMNIRDYQLLRIEFGWVNDDFQRNQVTMIGEKRLLAYIKSNYLTAFMKGKYATIMEAIAKADEGGSDEGGGTGV